MSLIGEAPNLEPALVPKSGAPFWTQSAPHGAPAIEIPRPPSRATRATGANTHRRRKTRKSSQVKLARCPRTPCPQAKKNTVAAKVGSWWLPHLARRRETAAYGHASAKARPPRSCTRAPPRVCKRRPQRIATAPVSRRPPLIFPHEQRLASSTLHKVPQRELLRG